MKVLQLYQHSRKNVPYPLKKMEWYLTLSTSLPKISLSSKTIIEYA